MRSVYALTDTYASTVSLQNNPILVASYDDGTPLVAYNPINNLVAVNTYVGDDRQFSGDMANLCHNAAWFAAEGPAGILYIDGGSGSSIAKHDLQTFTDIGAIHLYDGTRSTPSLSFLQSYDVVVA